MRSVSSNVMLPELPDAKMETRKPIVWLLESTASSLPISSGQIPGLSHVQLQTNFQNHGRPPRRRQQVSASSLQNPVGGQAQSEIKGPIPRTPAILALKTTRRIFFPCQIASPPLTFQIENASDFSWGSTKLSLCQRVDLSDKLCPPQAFSASPLRGARRSHMDKLPSIFSRDRRFAERHNVKTALRVRV